MASGSITVRSGNIRRTYVKNSSKAQKRGAGRMRMVKKEYVGRGRY